MTLPFRVYTAPAFDRLLRKLVTRHPDLVDRYAAVLTILETDPQNQTGTHNIRKLQGSRYRTRSGRWRFIYARTSRCGRSPASPQRGRRAPAAPTLGLRTWTSMWTASCVDGVADRTGGRGYNPHQRKVPSTRSWVETTHILRVKNRSGNVHDGKAGLPFLRALWPQLVGLRTGGARLRFRMDGAFFRQDVLRWLQGRGVGYAITLPFYRWLDLQRYIHSPTWVPVAPGVTGFAVNAETPWTSPVTVTIYRKKVHHRATKNYQHRPV